MSPINFTQLSASQGRGQLLEGPCWSVNSDALLYTDILVGAAFITGLDGQGARIYSSPCGEKVSSVFQLRNSEVLLTGEGRVLKVDRVSGREMSLAIPSEPPTNRCNDAKPDPFGNLWVGTMDDSESKRSGRLLSIDAGGEVHEIATGLGIPNTLAWDLDRERVYFGDSMDGCIYWAECQWIAGRARIGPASVFAARGAAPGVPDGSAIDAEGNIWNARWDGGCVAVFSPDGDCLDLVQVGARRPTSCAFVGPDLETLAVTTASVALDKLSANDGHVLLLHRQAKGAPVAEVDCEGWRMDPVFHKGRP